MPGQVPQVIQIRVFRLQFSVIGIAIRAPVFFTQFLAKLAIFLGFVLVRLKFIHVRVVLLRLGIRRLIGSFLIDPFKVLIDEATRRQYFVCQLEDVMWPIGSRIQKRAQAQGTHLAIVQTLEQIEKN
jgi:hypothetical protein